MPAMLLHNRDKSVKNSKKYSSNKDEGLFTSRHLVVYVFILTMPICSFGILRLVLPIFNSRPTTNLETSHHPTSIPWIENSRKCEDSGRFWKSGKCWDNKHSPQF